MYRNLEVGEVDIWQSIFQGDYLSPLVFALRLNLLSSVLRKANAAYKLRK